MLACQFSVHSKVDVLNPFTVQWCIGTVKSNQKDEVIEVEMDGIDHSLLRISDKIEHQERRFTHGQVGIPHPPLAESRVNWVFVQPTTIKDSITTLNTHTLNHYYVHNPSAPVCTQSNAGICSQCETKCCRVCNLCTFENQLYCSQCASDANDDTSAMVDRFCGICKAWLTNNNKNNCCRCETVYCNACGITSGKLHSCKKCEIQCQQKKYAKSIRSGIGFDVGIDITNMITSFCIGYIIYCGNIECCNQISINNQTELENGWDSEGNKIHQYKVRRVFASAFYSDSTCFLYGKIRRVLCSECTKTKLKRCAWGCDLRPWRRAPMFICDNFDVTDCCKNHAYCGYQSSYWKYARDEAVHAAPKCQYDMNLWINSGGKDRRCRWCWETRALTDPYYYYEEDWYWDCESYYDYLQELFTCEDADTSKSYGLSKDMHRKRHLCPSRDMMKNKKYNKKHRTKKYQKRKSVMRRKKDKKGSYESNMKFKKRYQLSLQY